MPRWTPGRTRREETWVAARIAREREDRGWSLETVAKAMSEAGCPIPPSAIHRIEKGDPPRRISLNEFLAFTEVFDVDRDELLQPVESADDRERLAADLQAASDALQSPVERYRQLYTALYGMDPERAEGLAPTGWAKWILQMPGKDSTGGHEIDGR